MKRTVKMTFREKKMVYHNAPPQKITDHPIPRVVAHDPNESVSLIPDDQRQHIPDGWEMGHSKDPTTGERLIILQIVKGEIGLRLFMKADQARVMIDCLEMGLRGQNGIPGRLQ